MERFADIQHLPAQLLHIILILVITTQPTEATEATVMDKKELMLIVRTSDQVLQL